jgi:hypothetical protein
MEQLSFFEATGVQVIDAAKRTQGRRSIAEKTPTVNEVTKSSEPLQPTWEVHFFDTDGRQRVDWQRAQDEEKAKTKTLKEWGAKSKIYHAVLSKRTLEEIEALD